MKEKQLKLFHKDVSELLWDLIKYISLFVFIFVCAYPFYYVIIYSFSDPQLALRGIYLLPKGFTLENYKQVLALGGIAHAFFISVARTVLGTMVSLVSTSFLAYMMTKDFWGKKVVYRFIIITMYLSAGLIPWYLVMSTYGLTNNFLAYIIPNAISAYHLILIKTFMEQLPASMEESATLDGAGLFTIFFRIIVPLSKPILATIAVYCMVGQWNSWQDNFFLNSYSSLETIQLLLRRYLTAAEQLMRSMAESGDALGMDLTAALTPESIRMTAVVITMTPVMFVYPFAQKYFTKGIMMGAVKG